ncbi:MAG: PD-(D/E)XK nuclease family protein [Anaerolineae bacterium]
MTAQLYLSPAASGKTAHVLDRARDLSRSLTVFPRVVVPSNLQVRACRRRLADAGGSIGVRIITFAQLQVECLNLAGEIYTELTDPVQYRLIRTIVDHQPLTHYQSLQSRPGFTQILQHLIAELKAARIDPDRFRQAVAALGDEPRLAELALIYAEYQRRLQQEGWADLAGMAWLAVEALETRAPTIGSDWPFLALDGFDDFTESQLALIATLAPRVGELIITLTGVMDAPREQVHRRFLKTRRRVETRLDIRAEPLPHAESRHAAALTHLEQTLYAGDSQQAPDDGTITLIQAPERAAEVRAALRWCKQRIVADGHRPDEVALLARGITPYRPFIIQTAAEFGLPIKLADGLPLRSSPVVSALLDLLRLTFLEPGQAAELTPRLVLAAWRSPYFDWAAEPGSQDTAPVGILEGEVDALHMVAQWGRVIGGLDEWDEAFDSLVGISDEAEAQDERRRPGNLPTGEQARELRAKFDRFVARLRPLPGARSYRDYTTWLETLIGEDSPPDYFAQEPETSTTPTRQVDGTSLHIVRQVRAAKDETAELDLAALQALKDVLRGLVWAEEAISDDRVISPATFLNELAGAIDAANYYPPIHPEREEILVTNVIRARGVALRSVAILGMAEGEFPAALAEDPFLRDADRAQLRERFGFDLAPSTESAEIELLYESLTRPRDRLLLTRPRLDENGAPWEASPYWEEVRRRVAVEPRTLTSETIPAPHQAASWREIIESLTAYAGTPALWQWARQEQDERVTGLEHAADRVRLRTRQSATEYDGDLHAHGAELARRFGPAYAWSASSLEAQRTCPFYFFVGRLLKLEPREEPEEGLDRRQLGNLYHRILKELYADPRMASETDAAAIRKRVEEVAGPILTQAPKTEGFRATQWWEQTRAEMIATLGVTVRALAQENGTWAPLEREYEFKDVVIRDGDDQLRLRGIVDRIDRDTAGNLRVIDYKTSGQSTYTDRAIREGKKLQVPLYALAARSRLGGAIRDGFYWDIEHAAPGGFTLAQFKHPDSSVGAEAAIRIAVEHSWAAVHAVRAGEFKPHPPADGCPSHCPAAAFCWHYRPGMGA